MTSPTISASTLRTALAAAKAKGQPVPIIVSGKVAGYMLPNGQIAQDLNAVGPKQEATTVANGGISNAVPRSPIQQQMDRLGLNGDQQDAVQAALQGEGVGNTSYPANDAQRAAQAEGVQLPGTQAEKPPPTLAQTEQAITNARDAQSYGEALQAQQMLQAQGMSIWVNGVQLTPVLNSDGSPKTQGGQLVYAFGQYGSNSGGKKPTDYTMSQMPAGFDKPSTPGSVWDILNLHNSYGRDSAINPWDTFLVAGPGIAPGIGNFAGDTSGAVIDANDQHVSTGVSPYAGDLQDLQAGRTNMNAQLAKGYSLMTIGEGLQQIQAMANHDKGTYNQLINLLKHAGYDSSSSMSGGKALEGGVFTSDTAMALTHAMKDASMQLSYEMQNGGNPQTSLFKFLQDKVTARAQAAADAYEPMRRDYTDPAEVAAAARSAAQELIGRNLTQQEQAAFEANFHSQQVGQYNAADKALQDQQVASAQGTSSPGANITMPTASGEAQQYLMGNQFGGDRATYLSMQYLQGILSSLGVK